MAHPTDLWQTAGHALDTYLGRLDGSIIDVSPAGWLALSGAPIPETNMAALAASPDGAADGAAETLTRYVAAARERQTPLLVLIPQPVLDTLGDHPTQLGLAPIGAIPLMARDTSSLPDDGTRTATLSVERVTGPDALADAQTLIAAAFGLPAEAVSRYVTMRAVADDPVRLFLARREGAAVGTVLSVRQGDTVGLRFMATDPVHQRQGIGRALLGNVIETFGREGVRTIYFGTTEAGAPLYMRAGFQILDQTPVWIAMP